MQHILLEEAPIDILDSFNKIEIFHIAQIVLGKEHEVFSRTGDTPISEYKKLIVKKIVDSYNQFLKDKKIGDPPATEITPEVLSYAITLLNKKMTPIRKNILEPLIVKFKKVSRTLSKKVTTSKNTPVNKVLEKIKERFLALTQEEFDAFLKSPEVVKLNKTLSPKLETLLKKNLSLKDNLETIFNFFPIHFRKNIPNSQGMTPEQIDRKVEELVFNLLKNCWPKKSADEDWYRYLNYFDELGQEQLKDPKFIDSLMSTLGFNDLVGQNKKLAIKDILKRAEDKLTAKYKIEVDKIPNLQQSEKDNKLKELILKEISRSLEKLGKRAEAQKLIKGALKTGLSKTFDVFKNIAKSVGNYNSSA